MVSLAGFGAGFRAGNPIELPPRANEVCFDRFHNYSKIARSVSQQRKERD